MVARGSTAIAVRLRRGSWHWPRRSGDVLKGCGVETTSNDIQREIHEVEMNGLVCIGCGYSGEAIAKAWIAQGGVALGTTRAVARAEALELAGVCAVLWDPSDSAPPDILDHRVTHAVYSIPPTEDPAHDRALAATLTTWLARAGVQRVAYLSSTSVYGPAEAPVTDSSVPSPTTDRGLRRLAHERMLEAACDASGLAWMHVRLPGIYGPSRTVRDRLMAGTYRLVDGGVLWTNRIFVDDLASAALRVLESGTPGHAYLATDGHPFQVHEMIAFACEVLGASLPQEASLDDVPERVRDFWMGSKRCQPERLPALGWAPRFPSYREGLREAWRREVADLS